MEPGEYERLARLEEEHWWYVGMRRIAAEWLRTIPLPCDATILDAGCGTGGGLKWLAAFGTPTGLDLHPRAVHHASHASTRVARASIQAIPFPADRFDLVTSFDVLYHRSVTDDAQALCECARVLKPGGWLLARVPAHDWLRRAHDRQVHTRHRYAAGELRAKIAASGLHLRRLSSVGVALLPLAALSRFAAPNDQPASDVVLPAPRLNHALTAAFTLEARWLRYFDLPFGLSLLALARKPEVG
jgi:SAM-dependent methyltransferase